MMNEAQTRALWGACPGNGLGTALSQRRGTFPGGVLFGWWHWEVLSEGTWNLGCKGPRDGREVSGGRGREVPRAWKEA